MTLAAGLHPRRRARDAAGRAGARHAEAAARGRRASRSCCTSSRCWRRTGRAASCCASATSASGSRRASGAERFGIEIALPLRRAASWPARPGAVRGALAGARRARSSCSTATPTCGRLRARSSARSGRGLPGADDRAAQRGPLGRSNVVSRTAASLPTTSARRPAACTGSTTGSAVLTPAALDGGEADLAGDPARLAADGRARRLRGDRALLRDRHAARRSPRPTRSSGGGWNSRVRRIRKLATVTVAATPEVDQQRRAGRAGPAARPSRPR